MFNTPKVKFLKVKQYCIIKGGKAVKVLFFTLSLSNTRTVSSETFSEIAHQCMFNCCIIMYGKVLFIFCVGV